MIKTDRSGDDGIGGGEHRDEVQSIEDHTIADGEAFSLADIRYAGGWRHLVAPAAIVQHGKSIVIAFYKNTDHGRDPAHEGDERKDQQADQIDCLPQGVAYGHADTDQHVLPERLIEPHFILLSVEQGIGLLAEISEQGGADDEDEIFEEGKIEEDEDEVDHQAAHDEEEGQECALTMLQEPVDMHQMAEGGDDGGGGDPKEVEADNEQDRV